MADQTIFTDEILDWLVAKINTDLGGASELNLTLCQKGDLSYYPAQADISDDCPAVMVKCTDISFFKTVGNQSKVDYEATYRIRILYINTVTVTSNVITDTNLKARKIGEEIIGLFDMAGFSYSDKVSDFSLTGIDFEPPENDRLQAMDKELKCFAITCELKIYSRR